MRNGFAIIGLLALAMFLAGCETPQYKGRSEITKADGTKIVMETDERGAQLFFGNRTQSTFPDGSTEQGITKEVTGDTATGLANTAAGAALGLGAGSVVGQPLAGGLIGAGAGAIADQFTGKAAKEETTVEEEKE